VFEVDESGVVYFMNVRSSGEGSGVRRDVVLGKTTAKALRGGLKQPRDATFWTSDGWFAAGDPMHATSLFANPGPSLSCQRLSRFGVVCLMADWLGGRIVGRFAKSLLDHNWSDQFTVLEKLDATPYAVYWHPELSPNQNQTLFFTYCGQTGSNNIELVRIDLHSE
jgi:hypothetical protein